MVDFYEPWLQLLVYQDVKPENLKTFRVQKFLFFIILIPNFIFCVVLLVVLKAGLDRTESLDDNLLDFEKHGILSLFAALHVLFYPLKSRLESPFVALV
jgi:hypothetical protein